MGESRRTVAGKVGDSEGPSQLQLVVVGRDPGQDPLEHAALAPLKQLLHGLVCTQGRVEGRRLVTGATATSRCQTLAPLCFKHDTLHYIR